MKKQAIKRAASVLLALCLVLCLVAVPAFAEGETYSGTCGENLTWTLADGVLTISGEGEMEEYSYGSAAWYSYCDQITSVVIEEGVTSIGDSAFFNCSGLTSVTIPVGVTSIGDSAFFNCSGLTSVTIPVGVTSIGYGAFNGCTGLTSVTIPDGVTSIGNYAFWCCSGLTSITIPDGVTSIADYAFEGCTSLTSVTIPAGVTSIGGFAFSNCTGLTGITIPEGVTSIGNWAFYNCSSLTSIAIPESVPSIGQGTFWGCTGLASVTIPEGVTSFGEGAFYGCTGLTDVYYAGSEEEWAAISQYLGLSATIHYNSTGPEEPSIIIDGTSDSYTQGSENAAVIHCSGALADFVSVSVDGAVVSADNYTLTEGSTVLTFKASYLETLSVGKHTVTLAYKTGSVDTSLTVLEKASTNPGTTEPETTEPETTEPETTESDGVADETNPKDGDSAILLLPAGLMLACALSLLYLNRKKRVQ